MTNAISGNLGRRRAASDRLTPLADGRRDPLDLLPPPQPARCVVTITIDHQHHRALVRGWMDAELVIDSGHTPRWSRSGAGWCIDASAVADVITVATRHHRIVEVHGKAPAPVVVMP